MIGNIISLLSQFAVQIVDKFGYGGVAMAMAIQSANIPLPSEIIMPFAGYLASQSKMTLLGVTLAGSLGGTIGSVFSYGLGYYGGEKVVRNLIKKYGRYVLIFEYELDHAVDWLKKHGQLVTFTARMLPVIRTFISLPAGFSKIDFKKFTVFAFLGTFIWSLPLAYLGEKLGENWQQLSKYFHKFDFALVVLGFLVIIIYIAHKLRKNARYQKIQKQKTT